MLLYIESKYPKVHLVKIYNDSLISLETKSTNAYKAIYKKSNADITKAINSLSKKGNYNYILSKKNDLILFANDDDTNNLTPKILKLLKLKNYVK